MCLNIMEQSIYKIVSFQMNVISQNLIKSGFKVLIAFFTEKIEKFFKTMTIILRAKVNFH